VIGGLGSFVPGIRYLGLKDREREKHCGEEAGGVRGYSLFLWDRPHAFRPRVLFLENAPA
jgi:hypothetical protein